MVPGSLDPPDSRSDEQSAARSLRPASLQPQDAFTTLSRLVVGTRPLDEVVTRVAELARACVPGADGVSVTVIDGTDRARTAAFTDRRVLSLDERQYEAGFGPCLVAAENGQVVRVDDTAEEVTFPEFAALAAREGVRNTVSVGMPMLQRIAGGINVYRFEDTLLDEDSVQLLQVFTSYAAVALANHSLTTSAGGASSRLQTAVQSRAVVEQAKGMLMAMLHCSAEEAFAHLVTQSRRSDRPLPDVAAEIVANL